MHRAAVLRVRMTNQRGFRGRQVFGFFEQSFQPSGGAGEEKGFDFSRHSFSMEGMNSVEAFRSSFPERTTGPWRYRVLGAGERTLLALPGGELVNDLGFEFAMAMSRACRVIYPAYPRASSIIELADGLCGILDVEKIDRAALLGASFGGAVAQIFVRRHPDRTSALILSNTGVPLKSLAPSVRISGWIAAALPWSVTSKLLRKPLLKTLDPAGRERAFWSAYLDELFSERLTKADVLSNIRHQYEYHTRFRFTPQDLSTWTGKVLIAESDTDIIGPRRRKALRDLYPQAEVRTFHNAGHAPMFSCAEEYLAMVRAFL